MDGSLLALASLVVALYTGNYALETWRDGNRFGGAGLLILSLLTAVVPAVFFMTS